MHTFLILLFFHYICLKGINEEWKDIPDINKGKITILSQKLKYIYNK